MTITEMILISFGLAMDCFAAALGIGACYRSSWKTTLVMAAMFGLFQGAMPVAGWLIGSGVKSYIGAVDHWIAFGILAFIGLKMIRQSFRPSKTEKTKNIENFGLLITLAIATSIDAMVTGVGFGLIEVNILMLITLIAVITFAVTLIGVKLGEKTSFIPARWAEFTGGLVLIGIGLKVLADHLMA